jgi:hypothetical protein
MTGWIPPQPSTPAYSHARDVGKKYREKIPAIFLIFPVAPGHSPRTAYVITESLGIVAGCELALNFLP